MGEENAPPKFLEPYVEEFTRVCTFIRQVLGSNLNALLSGSISILLDCIIELKANIETCSPESFYIHRLSPKQLFENLVTFVTWCDGVYGNHQSIESQQPPQTLPNIETTFNFETIVNNGNVIKEYEKAKDNYIGLMHLQRVESEFYRLVQGISFAKEKSVKTANKNCPKTSEANSNEKSMDKNANTDDYKSNQSLSSINSLLLTDNSIYDDGSQYFEPNRNNSSKEVEKIGHLTTSKNLLCEPKYAPPLIKMTSSDFGDIGKMNAGNRDSQIFSSEDTECTSNNSMFDLNSEDSYYEKSSSLGYSSSSITLANNRNSNTPKQSLDNHHTQKIENTNNHKEKSKIRRPTPLNLSADKNYGEVFHEKNSNSQIPSNAECPQKYVPPWVKKLIEPSNPVKNHQQFVPENYFLNAKKNCTQKRDFSKSDINTSLLNFVQTPTLLEHSHKFSLHEYGGIKEKNEDDSLPKQTQKNKGKNFTKNNEVNHQSFQNNLREHRNNSSPTPSVLTLTEYSMLSDSENRSQSTYNNDNNEEINNGEFNLQTFMRNQKHANHRLFMTSSPNPSKEEGGTFRKANNIGNEKTEKNDRIKAKAKLVRKTVLEIKLPRGVQASQVLQELNRRLVDIENTNTNNANRKNDEKTAQNNSPNKKVIHSENDKIDFMEGDIIDSVILEQRDDYGENASISNIFTPESLTSRNPIAENCFSVLTPPSSPIPLNSLQAKNRIQPNNIDQARYVISRPANDNNKSNDEQMQKVTPKINNTSSSEKCCKEKTCEENSKNLAALDCETENEIERLLSSMQSTVQELSDSQRSCHLNHHKNISTSDCQNTTSAKNLNNNQTLDDNISISTINTTFNNLFGNRDTDSSVFSIESGQIFTFDRASINSDHNKTTHFDEGSVAKKLGQQSNSFLANNNNKNNKKSFDQVIDPNCNNNSNKDIKNHQMNKDVIGYVKKVHETGRNYIKDTHSYYFKTIPTNGQEEPRKADCKKKSETINNKESSIINNHPKISENVTNYVKTIGEYNGLAMDTDPFSFIRESTEYFIKDIEKYWKTLNIYTDLSENTIPFDNDKRNERFSSSTSKLNENNRQKLPQVSKLLPNIQIKSNQTCLQNAIITEGNLFEHIIQDFTQLSSKPKQNMNNRNLASQNQRPPQEEQIYDRIDVCNFKNARKNGSTFNNTNYSDNIIKNYEVQDRECRIFDAYHFKASSNKINLDNRPAAKISEPFTSNTTLYKLRRSDSAKETIEQLHPQNLSPHNRIDDNRSFHFTGRDAKIIYSDDTLVSRLNQKDSPTLQKPKLRLEGQERDIITLLKSPMIKAPSSLLKPSSMIKPILKRQSSISTSSYETYNTSSTKTGTTHSDTLENNVFNIKPPLPETVKTEYQTSLYDLVPKDIDLVFRDTQTQFNSSNEGNLNFADNCTSKSTLPYRSTLVNGKHRKFVQSGSIIAFIVYATCPMQNDFLFQEAFVLTYRLFMTPCVLLDLLIKRLSHFQRACVNGSTLFKRAYRSTFSFLYRILDDVSFNEITDATKYTINNNEFKSNEMVLGSHSDKLLLQSLKHQIQSMFEIGEIQLATILQGKLEIKLMKNDNGLTKSTIMDEKTEKMINFTALSPALMSPKTQNNNISNGIPSPLTNSPYYMARKDAEPKFKFENDFTELFLNAKSRDIAEQLTFLDAQLFCRLSMNECLIWALKRNETLTPNLSTFTKHFNDVSYWCRTMILAPPIGIKRRKNSKDSQHNFNHINNLTNSLCNTTPNLTNTDDANNQITQEFISGLRLKVYRKFLKVMRHLRYEYYNFNALLALLSALDSSPISRLLEDNSNSKVTPSPCNSPCKKYCCPDKNRNQGVFDKRLNNNNLSQRVSYNNANKSDAAMDHGMNYQRRLSDNLLSRNKSKMETSPFFASKQRKRSLSRGRRPKSPSSEILVMSPKSNLIARKSFGTPQNFMRDNFTTNSSAISTNSNAFINPTRNKDEKISQMPAAPMLNLIKLTDKEMTLLQTLRELVDSSGSFKNYRKTLAEIVPPCIPYVGLILQDLTFIDVGNPTYTPDGLINFVKCWQIFSVLHSLKRFKNKTYKIKQDEQIISIFDNFQYHLADDELWNISETIKPRRKIL